MSEQKVPIQERTQTPSHANRGQSEVVSVIRHTVASGKERLCFTLCGTRALARLGIPIAPHPIL
jgi:hypothetical protein